MIPLGILGQVYAVCAAIGSIFVLGSFVMGHFGEDSGDGGGGDDGGYDGGAGDDGGAGNDFSAGDDGGPGNDFGAADDGGIGGKLTPMAGHRMTPLAGSRLGGTPKLASGVGGFILALLSPMTWAVYMAFFGLTGLFLGSAAPWLGAFTLIPAVLVSLVVSSSFKSMTRWMMKNMHTSTHSKEADLIGQIAEVNIPIHDGRTGEVTYVIHSKRINASAQPAKQGVDFKKGAKVLIVGSKDHMVLVVPCDPELEERFIS